MSPLLRSDRLCDLSQPIFPDGPAWAEYAPPNVTHSYRRQAEGFNADTLTLSEEYLMRWPYLDGDGARLLLEHGICGVGIDALSIGGWGGSEKGEPSHVALLGAGKVVIEELSIPEEPVGRRCFLTAFPVLLEGCGGAWTRAVAWEIDQAS